jgi:membrane protein implicated in regulation of membrane protease activity
MNWESFYLGVFLFGLVLTLVSLFAGHVHLPLHLPHALHALHLPGGAGHIGPINTTTLVVFMTWFGATGYLVTHYHSAAAGLALTAAIIAGFIGATLMYVSVIRTFMLHERSLREEDFDMTGVLGHISSPVRENGGTGELIYTQQGTRRSCGARTEDGQRLERGTEVVVLKYEKGIAWVRPWDDLHKEA